MYGSTAIAEASRSGVWKKIALCKGNNITFPSSPTAFYCLCWHLIQPWLAVGGQWAQGDRVVKTEAIILDHSHRKVDCGVYKVMMGSASFE